VTKADFQKLAEMRIEEAKALLDLGHWSGAYYLAGYAVECGLKACIANLLKSEVFPEKSFTDKCYVHDLDKLVVLAGLKSTRDADTAADPALLDYWATVADWTEQSRYDEKDEKEARDLYTAITDATSGVLPWVKRYW
jgi:HEPN domain-containing protein